jgi:hypothetical protein
VRRWGAGSLGGQGVAMTAGKGAETGKASPMGYRGVSRAGGWAQGVCVGYGTAGPAHEWSTEEQHPGMFLLLPDRLAAGLSLPGCSRVDRPAPSLEQWSDRPTRCVFRAAGLNCA